VVLTERGLVEVNNISMVVVYDVKFIGTFHFPPHLGCNMMINFAIQRTGGKPPAGVNLLGRRGRRRDLSGGFDGAGY